MIHLAVVMFALVSVAASPPTVPGLFSAIEQRSSAVAGPDPTIIRRRSVAVAHEQLSHVGRSFPVALNFNLFRDVQLQGMMTGVVAQSALGSVFAGHLQGIKDGRFMLAVQGDVVLGNIRAPGVGYFQIRHLGNGVHDVREIDESEFPPCATDEHDDGATPPTVPAPRGEPGDCDDDGSVIDLMVVYTAEARVAQGGTAAIEALIALSEAETNQAYANSLIQTTSVRVVLTHEVDYAESGNSSTDRARLSAPDDGFMDEVPVLRDQVRADVVTLIANNLGSTCGQAFFSISAGNVPHPELGFNVVRASCSAGNFTFGHELGHNQGCRHDRGADSSDGGAFLYSHGYKEAQGLFRSVMAVSTADVPRIQYFSSPDVLFQGEPTGIPVGDPASAHNALTIENTAYNVANFRRSNDCNDNGVCDDVEIATGVAQDCNGNGRPDDCDNDCNGNGAADECDIAQGVSQDCTGNGVPDECEPDCNENGVADSCDILNGTSADDNGDGFPDECEQPLLFVDLTATSANDGTSWSDAFVSPRDAFALAADPRVGVQEIWVAAGVYKPDVANGDRAQTFRLPMGVGIFGGFAGGESNRDQRDPRLHETVFSGDLNGDDDGTVESTVDNSYHVVTLEGFVVDTPTVFDGFVVKSGNSRDAPSGISQNGAGMKITGAAPIVRDCLFTHNSADDGAGLQALGGASPLVSRCRFVENVAGAGAAIEVTGESNIDVRDSVFFGNAASGRGSAVFVTVGSRATISHCTFVENPVSGARVGVISSVVFSRVDISGSIIWNTLGSRDLLIAGLSTTPSTLTVQHSVVRGGVGSVHVAADSTFVWGAGNIDEDPLLHVDGVHLTAQSPCIGRGDPAREPSSLDIDGEPRVQSCRADMGADETDFTLDCDGNGQSDACEIEAGASEDFNLNGVLDECESSRLSYVDVANCPGPGSGTKANPFCDLQTAIDSALQAPEAIIDIVAADGMYQGPNNRDLEFGSRAMRLRSANGPQNCIIDAGGAGRVASMRRAVGWTVLDGFTIQGGVADVGGGIYVQERGCTIRNCIIRNNTANTGGGIAVDGGISVILNCVVNNNRAERVDLAQGGGVFIQGSLSTLIGSTIEDNLAASADTGRGAGGGAHIRTSTATLVGCTIRNNTSGEQGGGVYTWRADVSFRDCVIRRNVSKGGGGAYHGESTIRYMQCQITGNEGSSWGGGIRTAALSQGYLSFASGVIYGNTAGQGGGIFVWPNPSATQILDLTNSILWGNTISKPFAGEDQLGFLCQGVCENRIGYNAIQEWTGTLGGEGNFGDDPAFVDPDGPDGLPGTDDDDLHVHAGSPVIDAGDNLSVPLLLTTDFEGKTRFLDDVSVADTGRGEPPIVDIGIYEGRFDCNGNGVPDLEDIANGTSADCNANGLPDLCDIEQAGVADCDGNEIPDECEDTTNDCNNNGVWDGCDLADGTSRDCNASGIPDECELADGTSQDCNATGIPDECETDCNVNGLHDDCDIANGTSLDDNVNGVPDECERPPLQALPPHDVRKNRYVSFTPNAAAVVVAYRIEGLTNAYFPDVVGVLGWVDMPDEDGMSLLTQNPVYRDDWPSVVHVGDCAIVPVATYAVSATPNGVHFSDSLTVETVRQPGGGQFWGDTVGTFDGTQWTPPQGQTNINDAIAAIKSFQVADGAPHVSVTDVEPQHPNRVVNINDVLRIILAFQGNRYPYGCPDDPCRDNLANPCP